MAEPIIPRELMQFFNSSREIQRYFNDLGIRTDEWSSKVPGATDGNIIIFDANGNLEDSGESIDSLRARSYFYGRVY